MLAVEVEGYICPGLDDLIMKLIKSIFNMYSGTESIPIFICTNIRELIDNATQDLLNKFSQSTCPSYEPEDQAFLDFRELFFNASGTMPYGDLFPTTMGLLTMELIYFY